MINKTFRLFISSTFSDFLDERTVLNEQVYKIVNRYCQRRGYSFQMTDLRWGVSTETALNQKTLEICLDEVKRCKALSPRPNFLLMIGERYGWIPLPYAINSEEYETIYADCNSSEKQMLDNWYRYDKNSINSEYNLLPRTGRFEDESTWAAEEDKLRNIMVSHAIKCGLPKKSMMKYVTSATEREIIEGFLGNDIPAGNTVAIFRNNGDAFNDDCREITILREKIASKMNAGNCTHNLIELDNSNKRYLSMFRKRITKILLHNINEEIDRLEHINLADNDAQTSFENRRQALSVYTDAYFYKREEELKQLDMYVNSENHRVQYISGESGSGKTTLLANFLMKTNCYFVYSFYGMDDKSYTILSAISHICKVLSEQYSLNNTTNMINSFNMTEEFLNTLSGIPKQEKVVIVIDGLDNFHDIDDINENIFPDNLPGNVKMIVSSANEKHIDKFSMRKSKPMNVTRFDSSDSAALFGELMQRYNRRIENREQSEIINRIFMKSCNPLHIKLTAAICKNWHSYDKADIIADTEEEIVFLYIENMYKKYGHDKDLVINALAFIAASPHGITEEELQVLLFRTESVRKNFETEDRYDYKSDKLPFFVWSRLFYDLDECLVLAASGAHIVLRFAHHVFYRVINNKFSKQVEEAREALIEFYKEKPIYIHEKTKAPDLRKLRNLTALYRTTGRISELTELMSDIAAADAAVKTMSIDEVGEIYRELITDSQAQKKEVILRQIMECITNNYDFLSCYKNEFYQCAYGSGINTSEKPVLEWHKHIEHSDIEYFSVPYGLNSMIEWSPSAAQYAVYSGSYVYICKRKSNIEIARVYFGFDAEQNNAVHQMIWMNENSIAINVYNKGVYIYNINDGTAHQIESFDSSSDSNEIAYSFENNILIVQNGSTLCAYNPFTGESLYSITMNHIRIKDNYVYCISHTENELNIAYKNQTVEIYDIVTGKYLSKNQFANDKSCFNGIDISVISQISDDELMSVSLLKDKFILFNKRERRNIYIILPNHFSINKFYIFSKYLVCVYENCLICVDLQDNCKMRSFYAEKILNVSYIQAENALSISSANRIYIVPVEQLMPLDGKCSHSMLFKRNINASVYRLFNMIFSSMLPEAVKLYVDFAYNSNLNYRIFNMFQYENPLEMLNEQLSDNATIIEYASDGKFAIAYEGMDAIKIFNCDGKEIWIFDKLHLTLDNSILRMFFSDNARYFCVWRNYSAKVINLDNGKCVLDLNLTNRNALNADFSMDNNFTVTLYDNITYKFILGKRKSRCETQFPKKMNPEKNCFGPYTYISDNNKVHIIPLVSNTDDLWRNGVSPSKAFVQYRLYTDSKHYIMFTDGHYLIDDIDQNLMDIGYDFILSLQKERMKDISAIMAFLREKNDLMSKIIEINERYLILITRLINSVIVFDCEKAKVIAAYKHYGKIIGEKYCEKDRTIELFSDLAPNRFKIKINLPK